MIRNSNLEMNNREQMAGGNLCNMRDELTEELADKRSVGGVNV